MITRRGFFPVVLGLLGFAATAEAKPRRPKPRPKAKDFSLGDTGYASWHRFDYIFKAKVGAEAAHPNYYFGEWHVGLEPEQTEMLDVSTTLGADSICGIKSIRGQLLEFDQLFVDVAFREQVPIHVEHPEFSGTVLLRDNKGNFMSQGAYRLGAGMIVEEWRELHGDKEMLWQAIQQQLGSFHPKFPWMVATRIEDIKHVGQTKHTFRVIYKVSEVPL